MTDDRMALIELVEKQADGEQVETICERAYLPPLGLSVLVEAVGEEGPEVGGKPGVAGDGFALRARRGACRLGAGGAEIHEPVPKQRPRHGFQRGIHPAVQLDLVIQRPKRGGYGALFEEGRPDCSDRMNVVSVERRICRPDIK